MLKAKAIRIHEHSHDEGGFNASSGWLHGFKACCGISQLKISEEKLSSENTAVDPFKRKLDVLIQERGLYEEQIYNADESGLFW